MLDIYRGKVNGCVVELNLMYTVRTEYMLFRRRKNKSKYLCSSGNFKVKILDVVMYILCVWAEVYGKKPGK